MTLLLLSPLFSSQVFFADDLQTRPEVGPVFSTIAHADIRGLVTTTRLFCDMRSGFSLDSSMAV